MRYKDENLFEPHPLVAQFPGGVRSAPIHEVDTHRPPEDGSNKFSLRRFLARLAPTLTLALEGFRSDQRSLPATTVTGQR